MTIIATYDYYDFKMPSQLVFQFLKPAYQRVNAEIGEHNKEVIRNYELPQSNAAAALRAISTRSFSWYVTSIYV